MKNLFNKFLSKQSENAKKSVLRPEYIEDIVKDIENEPFALSDENVLYAGLNELGGFYYFQTVVVGTLKFKSKHGAKLRITGKDLDLELNSDMLELQSDHTEKPDRFISKIDFYIVEENIPKIDRNNIEKIVLKIKKEEFNFNVIPSKHKEEEE